MKALLPDSSRAALIALASGCLAATAVFSQPSSQKIKAHFTPKQQQTERYVYVPFDVPSGTTRIDIELKYQKTDLNVVDLALMEPGSASFGTKAFRGWSGGERSAIFVSTGDATPGYWPGPIPVGKWNVVLGLYKVGPEGVDVEVTIRASITHEPPPKPLPPRSKAALRGSDAWYSGQLHAHTHNSDGALSVQALATKARADGLDFLAITDHNTTAQQREPIDVPELLTIIGEEVTTPGGHASVWGLGGVRELIDFRVMPGDPRIQSVVDEAVTKGAVSGINHPFADCVACSWTHPVPQRISTIEISGREPAEMYRAVALWDALLREGRKVAAVGVADWHRGDSPLGSASVRVFASELSERAILDGLRAGRVVVMMDGKSAPPELRVVSAGKVARVGDTLTLSPGETFSIDVALPPGSAYEGARVELFWNGERLAAGAPVQSRFQIERFAATRGYVRAHILTPGGTPVAVTNPIWIEVAAR